MTVLTKCQELEENLRLDILSGKLPGRRRIPSESVLAARYSICRSTVRKALNNLEKDGLLYAVRGSGTFVAPAQERHFTRRKIFRGRKSRKTVLFLSFSSSYSETMFRQNLNYRNLFKEMSLVLEPAGCDLMFVHVGVDFKPPQCLVSRDIDGILFLGQVPPDFWNRYMAGIPCIALNQFCPELNCTCVRSDPQMRAWLAVSHLKELGHTRIGYLADEIEEPLQKERHLAFLNMLAFLKLPHQTSWDAVWQRPRVNGELLPENELPDYTRRLKTVMARPDAPTAFVCLDCWRAKCAHAALEKLGHSVPREVSLVGAKLLQDSYLAEHKGVFHDPDYSFYTVLIEHSEQVYRQAVYLLLDQMFTPGPHPVLNQLIVPELAVRSSTAPRPEKSPAEKTKTVRKNRTAGVETRTSKKTGNTGNTKRTRMTAAGSEGE